MNSNYRARLSIADSHKSTGNGPVRSPVCNPSKKTKNTKQTTKANKQTQENKQTKKTATKNQQTKQKQNNQKKTKKWDRYQKRGFMHDDILCVMMIRAPNKKQNTEPPQKHQGPNQRVQEATKLNAETRDPPSQDPRNNIFSFISFHVMRGCCASIFQAQTSEHKTHHALFLQIRTIECHSKS